MTISFTCPQCGTGTQVDDAYAGQSGPCAHCGATVTIPDGGYAPTRPASSSSSAGTTIAIVLGVGLLGLLICGGGVAAFLIPAVSAAREAARRMQCQSNLKQIGLALHNYHDTYKTFPAPYIADANGKPMHSWRAAIMDFLEASTFSTTYNFNEPWDSPANSTLHDYPATVFQCPSDGTSLCNYFMIVVPGGLFEAGQWNGMGDAADGTSKTIMVVEATGANVHWLEPYDLGPQALAQPINSTTDGTTISSVHPGGAMVVFADGRVTFLSESTAQAMIQAMVDKADGQRVSVP